MDQVLQGIPGVQCYLDDIIVTGATTEKHVATLKEVLARLEAHGLRANKEECKFSQDSVTYCGHVIAADGLHTLSKQTRAIASMPSPQDVSQLRSFLGMVQYFSRFLPNLATTLSPLHRRLTKGVTWSWGSAEETAFQTVKKQLMSDRVLMSFNPSFSVVVACDSSAYGIGAVLSHRLPDGTD